MRLGDNGMSLQRVNIGLACALAFLAASLQGCALYSELMRRGGSLPLGEGGAEWSPAVTTPTGGAFGVQIIQRF